MKQFRLLTAEEIECRISQCSKNGVGLLLYKDARCDQNILDETVGSMNWQRHHLRDNANCVVSIWDEEKKQWVEKEDTGTESYTEKEKGLASDSFKRACFNWGIGRELYTAPFMWVKPTDLQTLEELYGKWVCRDSFTVQEIEYSERKIVYVKIMNNKTKKSLEFGTPTKKHEKEKEIAEALIGEVKIKALLARCENEGVDVGKILKIYKVSSIADLKNKQYANIIQFWQRIKAEE